MVKEGEKTWENYMNDDRPMHYVGEYVTIFFAVVGFVYVMSRVRRLLVTHYLSWAKGLYPSEMILDIRQNHNGEPTMVPWWHLMTDRNLPWDGKPFRYRAARFVMAFVIYANMYWLLTGFVFVLMMAYAGL